jgi:hypothetical protein
MNKKPIEENFHLFFGTLDAADATLFVMILNHKSGRVKWK